MRSRSLSVRRCKAVLLLDQRATDRRTVRPRKVSVYAVANVWPFSRPRLRIGGISYIVDGRRGGLQLPRLGGHHAFLRPALSHTKSSLFDRPRRACSNPNVVIIIRRADVFRQRTW